MNPTIGGMIMSAESDQDCSLEVPGTFRVDRAELPLEVSVLPTGSSPGSRTVMATWAVPRALETQQMKVVLMHSSEGWSRSRVPWGIAEGGRGPVVVFHS